jgi:hypothetical protein
MISSSRKLTEEPCTVKCGQKNRFERQFDLALPTCGQPVTKITIQYRTSISLLSMQDFIVRKYMLQKNEYNPVRIPSQHSHGCNMICDSQNVNAVVGGEVAKEAVMDNTNLLCHRIPLSDDIVNEHFSCRCIIDTGTETCQNAHTPHQICCKLHCHNDCSSVVAAMRAYASSLQSKNLLKLQILTSVRTQAILDLYSYTQNKLLVYKDCVKPNSCEGRLLKTKTSQRECTRQTAR